MHLAIARNDGATGGSNVFPGNPVRYAFPCNGRVSPCKMIGGQDAEETNSLRIRWDRSPIHTEPHPNCTSLGWYMSSIFPDDTVCYTDKSRHSARYDRRIWHVLSQFALEKLRGVSAD